MKKFIPLALFIVIILVVALTLRNSNTTSLNGTDIIKGDMTINAGDVVTIPSKGKVEVTGNLTVNGTLACDSAQSSIGTLAIEVGGTLTVNGKLECTLGYTSRDKEAPALTIVATHITVGQNAVIAANGSVDIVSEKTALLATPDAMKKIFEASAQNNGEGARVGPFGENNPTQKITPPSKNTGEANNDYTALLGGTWNIGDTAVAEEEAPTTPSEALHSTLHIDMGNRSTVTFTSFTGNFANGINGKNDDAKNCTARGGQGGNALRINVHAGAIALSNTTLNLGSGGKGGDAETPKDCPLGNAKGGNGGLPGNIKFTGTDAITISNVTITPGKGGSGGNAKAYGKNSEVSCDPLSGGNAEAIGGAGSASGYALSAIGNVTGIDSLAVARVTGGSGGNAMALPGNGSAGEECGCKGGVGGNGTAVSGNGGVGVLQLFSRTGEAHGGDAGNTETAGGEGGAGGSCSTQTRGGEGGQGGNAVTTEGSGGKGTTALGANGLMNNSAGGDGGRGGDGCPLGNGGKGGLGVPLGVVGANGQSLCPATPVIPQKDNSIPLIKAILYHSYYLPKNQLIISNGAGCGAQHYRAAKSSVVATDGTIVPDALFACGYGKVSETTVIDTPSTVIVLDGTQTFIKK